VNLSDRFTVSSTNIVHETIEGEVVIVNLENGYYYSADGIGSVIWTLLMSGFSCTEILDTLTDRYPGHRDEIERSAVKLISDLTDEDLITTAGGDTDISKPADPTVEIGRLEFSAPVLQKHKDMEHLLQVDPIHDVGDSGWPNTE